VETVIELLADAARRYDRRPALLIKPAFRTRRWRYRDLAWLAPRVARVLADAGLAPGDRAIIWAVNRPEWGIAFLGALHAGATLVPLDFRTQADFAMKVAERTGAKLVLASVQTAPEASRLGLPVVLIEQLPDQARTAEPLPTPPLGGDDLVEIVFTSGTTGDPKGAMLTHRNLVRNADALLEVFPLGPGERLLSVLPLSHLFEQTCGFLTPLLAGASVVYPVSRQPSVLIRTFRDFRATMLLIVPQGLKLLDNAIERRVDQTGRRAAFERLHDWARRLPKFARRILFRPVLSQFGGRLRTIAVGGAAMDVSLAERWTEMGLDVLQGYGATEMAPVISFTRLDRNRHGTVGEPIPGVEVHIASDGEVLARGPNRFVGYWQDPERTAEAIDAEGWYHTGDLGELSPDGFLTLRGRKKDMLAMPDGTKVYPEDIEAVLTRDERVRDAAVVGLGTATDLRIHAVLLLGDRDGVDPDAVVRDANATLGGHQQIRSASIWPDDDFPRTHTLKIKKRLVLERLAADPVSASSVSPRAPVATTTAPTGDGKPPPTADSLEGFIGLVAAAAGVTPESVTSESRLSSDLNMDSLARIELLGVIEEELGAFVDDAALDPEATVAEVRSLALATRDVKRETGIFGWPLNPLIRALGIGIQELLVLPLVAIFYRVRVRGEHHLKGLEGPVLFLPNHHLHTDNAIILTHLPLSWRWRLSIAAAADDIFGNPIRGVGAAIIGNAFPLAREGAVRRSFELLGARLDRDFSVLIFPEGKLTVGGPMQPFKAGAGLVAVEGATPVVPMRLKTHRLSWIDSRGPGTSPRGDVELVLGSPMWFPAGTDAAAATDRLEEAVAAL
jgi:long-chain acyl-CoA synthetase